MYLYLHPTTGKVYPANVHYKSRIVCAAMRDADKGGIIDINFSFPTMIHYTIEHTPSEQNRTRQDSKGTNIDLLGE